MILCKAKPLGAGRWAVHTPWHPRIVELCKQTPGLIWEPEGRVRVGYTDAVQTLAKKLKEEKLAKLLLPPPAVKAPSFKHDERLWDYQKEGADFLVRSAEEGALIFDDMGLGKQHPVDTLLITPSGHRPIGSLKPNDRVIGSDGRSVRVLGIHPQGKKPSYRITFSDASSVEAGPEHLWTVGYYVGGRHLHWITVTTEQIRTGAAITTIWPNRRTTSMRLDRTKLYLPMLSAPIQFDAKPLPMSAYAIGLLIANGSCKNGNGSVSLTVNSNDWPEIEKRLCTDGIEIGSVNRYGDATRAVLLGAMPVIKRLGLDELSPDKCIPEICMRASVVDRIALLQGLYDGDGSCSTTRNRVVYHTTSYGLAVDVRELVEQLGGIATIHKYDRSHQSKPVEYQIRTRLPSTITPFSVSRKASRLTDDRREPVRSIVSIEYVRDVKSVCISVDAPDQLYATKHAILTHNTRMILCAIEKLELPAVIVCPNAVKRSWVAEGKKLGVDVLPIFSTSLPEGEVRLTESDGIIVINYDIVHAWKDLLVGAKTIVLDEIHLLINEKSRRSGVCRALAKTCKYRIGATATPMTNIPKNLWNIAETISPGRFGKFYGYGLRYCDGKQIEIELGDGDKKLVWDWKGASNLDELGERVKQFSIRRLKKDVQSQLPPLIRQTIEVDVASDSLALEWSLKNSKATRLALSIAAQSKIPHAVEFAMQAIERGSSVVVFAHEKVVVREMEKALIEAGLPLDRVCSITGDVALEKREELAERMRMNGPSVIVATTHSIGVGVNYLTFADYAIFLELDYEPHWLLQSESRLHRTGQDKTVHAIYLVGIGTIDEAIRDAVLNKMATFEKTFGEVDHDFSKKLKKSAEDSLAELRDYLTQIGKEYYS